MHYEQLRSAYVTKKTRLSFCFNSLNCALPGMVEFMLLKKIEFDLRQGRRNMLINF